MRLQATAPSGFIRAAGVIMLGLFAVSLAFRLTGISIGLPFVVGADEGFEIHRALKLGRGEFDLERIGKGGFYYLLFVEYVGYFLFLLLTERVGSPGDFAARFASDITPFWLIARVTHVAVSSALLIPTFVLGKRAFGVEVGLIAAALLAVSPLMVSHSTFVGVDLPLAFLVTVTLAYAYRNSDHEEKSRPVLLGILFGVATITKAPGALLAIPLGLSLWLRTRGQPQAVRRWKRNLIVTSVVGGLTAVAGEPGLLVHGAALPSRLERIFGGPSGVVAGAGDPVGTPNLWLFYWDALQSALGLGGIMLAVAGVVLALKRRGRGGLLLISFVVPLYLALVAAQGSTLYYPRYLIPLVPLLAILAGDALVSGVRALPGGASGRTAVIISLTALLLAPLGLKSTHLVRKRLRPDSRTVAREWVIANVPSGAKVFLIGNPLSATAPNLSVPLPLSERLLTLLARELESVSTSKAEVLRLRQRTAQEPGYELVTVRHFEPNLSLEDYDAMGVRYFVLLRDHSSPQQTGSQTRQSAAVLASRASLQRDLASNTRARTLFRIDPEASDMNGPEIEIYELLEATYRPETG